MQKYPRNDILIDIDWDRYVEKYYDKDIEDLQEYEIKRVIRPIIKN
jgi:hypothetical protein